MRARAAAPMAWLLLLLMLAALSSATQAQNKKVYRCENAAGRVTYSDEPCRGGLELKNADERSANERQAAADVVKREEALAAKLARERRAAEKAGPTGAIATIPHSAAQEAAKDKPAKTTVKKRKKSVPAEKTQV